MATITRQKSNFECPKCAGQLHQVKLASIDPDRIGFVVVLQCKICRWYYKI